jgi:hypothetical protein
MTAPERAWTATDGPLVVKQMVDSSVAVVFGCLLVARPPEFP